MLHGIVAGSEPFDMPKIKVSGPTTGYHLAQNLQMVGVLTPKQPILTNATTDILTDVDLHAR